MAYDKTSWVDDSEPAINAENLNNIENGVSDVDSRLSVLEGKPDATWASLSDKPTIPSIEGLATQSDLDALAARVAALEAPSGE